jgi:hypothetical protein
MPIVPNDNPPSTRRASILLGALLAAAGIVALTLSLLFVPPDSVHPKTWKSYYTLYLDQSEDTALLSRRIASLPGIEAVVSRYTTTVSFNTFAGFAEVTVDGLSERLDPLDPRFDPYLRRVGRLFKISGSERSWEVLYLRSEVCPPILFLRLHRLLDSERQRWHLLEFDPTGKTLQLGLFAAWLLLLLLLYPSTLLRLSLVLGSLPWLALVLVGDLFCLLIFCLFSPLWMSLLAALHDCWKNKLPLAGKAIPGIAAAAGVYRAASSPPAVVRLLPAVLGTIGALVTMALRGQFLGVLLSASGGVLAAVLLYVLLELDLVRRAHPPFQPLQILRGFRLRKGGVAREPVLFTALLALALVGLPVLGLQDRAAEKPVYKVSRDLARGKRGELSWKSLSALYAASRGEDLPNLADYLSHRAFQEALVFGRVYGFPLLDERIGISAYRSNPEGNRIQKTFRVVKQFKASWLPRTLAAAPAGSVPRLLADQGVAAPVIASPAAEAGTVGWDTTLLAGALIALFLIIHLCIRLFDLTAAVLYATRILTLRRH